MNDFDKDFDELLKNALNNDSDFDGLSVDEDLIASTMKAIEEAAPRKEEIRASYDESFAEPQKSRKKGFFTKGNVIALAGTVAGIAAMIGAVVLFTGNNFGNKSEMASEDAFLTTSNEAPAAAAEAADSTTQYRTESAKEEESVAVEAAADVVAMPDSAYETVENDMPSLTMSGTQSADLYYFDDDDLYMERKSVSSGLLDNVFMVQGKEKYRPILEAINSVKVGDPTLSMADDQGVAAAGETEGTAGAEYEAGSFETDESAESDEADEEFDINDPAQLQKALEESNKMLEETGGLPPEGVEIIESVENIDGSTTPQFEYAPEKNPFWVDTTDSSDDSFAEGKALIVVYDQDVDADLDVCVMVYNDRCVIYDFAFDTTTTYTISDGQSLADNIRDIVSGE